MPIRREPGQNNGDRAEFVRGPSRFHGRTLTSMFGPARLLLDGWVCDMALRRLGCARIGDGDVVRAIVAGAAQMAPRRLRGPHVAVVRRGAVLYDVPGRLNVVRGVEELRERPRRVLVDGGGNPNWSELLPRPPGAVWGSSLGHDVALVWWDSTWTTYSCWKWINYFPFSQFLEVGGASS